MYIYYTYHTSYTLYIFYIRLDRCLIQSTYMYEDVCMYAYILHILYFVYIQMDYVYVRGCVHVYICITHIIHCIYSNGLRICTRMCACVHIYYTYYTLDILYILHISLAKCLIQSIYIYQDVCMYVYV